MAKTQYARSGDLSIAYQVFGDGPIDLMVIPGFVSNIELFGEIPFLAHFFDRLGSFARVVVFDKRGTGLSERTLGSGSAEDRMDDLRAVADAVGLERFALLGISEGGPLAILYATTYPERVSSLALWGTFARMAGAADYPTGLDLELLDRALVGFGASWGTGRVLRLFWGDLPDDEATHDLLARFERHGCTPKVALEILRANVRIDVRAALPAVHVPTLVVHREGDPIVPLPLGKYMAEHIAGARFVTGPGDFHFKGRAGGDDDLMDVVEEFFTGQPVRHQADVDRVLATVLFTDIVDSTRRAAALGDRDWKRLLGQHDDIGHREIDRHRGKLVKSTGDGLLATFDGPGRCVRAAQGIRDQVRPLGLDIRAGVHTGEIERRADDVAGIAVHIGARVGGLAGTGEVLVSSTVKDLVIGSGLEFADRGVHQLQGVPGDWHLWAALG